MRRIIEPVTIWDGANALYHDAALLIEGETIESIRTGGDRAAPIEADERIDGEGTLVIPGLINAHSHLYSSLARGMPLRGYAPSSFREILEQLWWRLDKALDPGAIRASALAGALDAARCGVTTLIDHHASPFAIDRSLESLCSAVCDGVGLRGVFSYEVSDRDGPAVRDAGIAENLRFLECNDRDGRAAVQFGLHASFTLGDETLDRVADLLPPGVGVHIHVAEGPEDELDCAARHGLGVAQRLDRFGLLRPRSILAHCVHLDEDEKDLVAERDAIVVHNPRSNMNNAVGRFDLEGVHRRGTLIGLGTDGLGSDLLGELFAAALLQKHSLADPLAAPLPLLSDLLFSGNPRIARRLLEIAVGRIAPGRPADLALIEYRPPTPLCSGNVLGHLLFGPAVHALRVRDLFVAGRPVLRNGTFTECDEIEALAHAREAADALWRRME